MRYLLVSGTDCAAHWATDAFGNDHFSQVVFGDIATTGLETGFGPAVRMHATDKTMYRMINSTDAAILSLLPSRDPAKVARFLRSNNAVNGAIRHGYSGLNLAGLASKRLAMRWYSYHSPDYEWQSDGTCTNGKIAHSSATWLPSSGPFLTLTVNNGNNGGPTGVYTFLAPGWNWLWSGHTDWLGFRGGFGPRSGAGVLAHSYRGKWFRNEIVVVNPQATDIGGYDFIYYVKNITDGTAEVEDVRFSAGCLTCLNEPQSDITWRTFTWDSSIHPTTDMAALHTEFYRAGNCQGWQGWTNLVVASWPTNAGQRIGAATEVEGGARTNLNVMGGGIKASGNIQVR